LFLSSNCLGNPLGFGTELQIIFKCPISSYGLMMWRPITVCLVVTRNTGHTPVKITSLLTYDIHISHECSIYHIFSFS